jgi:uncharacterized membrane protein (UPF0127 family)
MSVNKIIIFIGILFAIFITFIFIQFNPFGKSASETASTAGATVVIKDQTFSITVAQTEQEKQKGLSGVASLPLEEGKLFIFEKPGTYAFWMKDMKFPIDIIFINGDKIVSIAENAKPVTSGEFPVYQPTGPSDKALEINAGLSKKYNFKPGDKVEINLKN